MGDRDVDSFLVIYRNQNSELNNRDRNCVPNERQTATHNFETGLLMTRERTHGVWSTLGQTPRGGECFFLNYSELYLNNLG